MSPGPSLSRHEPPAGNPGLSWGRWAATLMSSSPALRPPHISILPPRGPCLLPGAPTCSLFRWNMWTCFARSCGPVPGQVCDTGEARPSVEDAPSPLSPLAETVGSQGRHPSHAGHPPTRDPCLLLLAVWADGPSGASHGGWTYCTDVDSGSSLSKAGCDPLLEC